jgi:hypothetical protein
MVDFSNSEANYTVRQKDYGEELNNLAILFIFIRISPPMAQRILIG